MYEKTQIKISSKMKEKAKYVEFQIDQIHQGDSACQTNQENMIWIEYKMDSEKTVNSEKLSDESVSHDDQCKRCERI